MAADLATMTLNNHLYTTRRVVIPTGVTLERGEAVEIDTRGDGSTTLDTVKKLNNADNLEGYMLHKYEGSAAGEPDCVGDVIFAAPLGLGLRTIYDVNKGNSAFTGGLDKLRVNGRIPLVDNEDVPGFYK